MKPLAIELYAGKFGWGCGLVAEGFRVIGFDILQEEYHKPIPPGCELALQDVLTLHGSQFRDAALIVASPPCQEFSYMAMPWTRGKQIAAALRGQGEFPEGYTGSRTIAELRALFDACFRIQREASEAAGRYIPMVVENVKGAQPWIGRAKAHFGSFYLWGDVESVGDRIVGPRARFGEALRLPRRTALKVGVAHRPDGVTNFHREDGQKTPAGNCSSSMWTEREIARYAHPTKAEYEKHGFDDDGRKVPMNFHEYEKTGKPGISFQSVAVEDGSKGFTTGLGRGHDWRQDPSGRFSSKSNARKAASAQIAMIPMPLAQYIGRIFKPSNEERNGATRYAGGNA